LAEVCRVTCVLASSVAVRATVQIRDLLHELPPVGVLDVHELVLGPVEMVGDEGYLLGQLPEGVA